LSFDGIKLSNVGTKKFKGIPVTPSTIGIEAYSPANDVGDVIVAYKCVGEGPKLVSTLITVVISPIGTTAISK
jgi:hypothetical protein